MFAGPQITDVCEREKPEADRLRRGVRRARRRGGARAASASSPGSTARPRSPATRCSRTSIARRRRLRRRAAVREGPRRDPHQRHDRHAEGRVAQAARVAGARPPRCSPRSRCKARERTMIAAPMFHSWGFAHFTLGLGLSSTLVLRRRFDPEDTPQRHRPARVHGAGRRAGDAAAHARAAAEDVIDRYDLSDAARHRGQRLRAARRAGDRRSWTPSATSSTTSTARPRSRGRRSPRPRTCAPRRAPPGARRGARSCGSTTPTAARSGRGRPAGSSSATRWSSRATRAAAARPSIDGLMSSGDVGHFDDGGRLFVDGRDDEMIVSGGENVFPREVEDLVAVAGRRRRGRGHRGRRREVRPAAQGVRRPRRGPRSTEDDVKAHVKENLARYKVPKQVVFMDELPRNATGKVLKRELAEQ